MRVFILLIITTLAHSAEPVRGPVVEGFGPAFSVEGLEVPIDTAENRAVVLDILLTRDDKSNPYLESAARYLNMHALRGVDTDKMRVAAVVHGPATFDILTDAAYRERKGADNPNSALLDALNKAGVDVYVCGQSLGFNGIGQDEVRDDVRIALSAMTTFEMLARDGYVILP